MHKSVVTCVRKATAALFTVGLIALCSPLLAQNPHTPTPADAQRINDLIHKMTLTEKLDYIGGTGFAVRAMPGLKLPAFEMSDGPYGTRSNAGFPSTTYAAGIGLAASWDRELASRVGAGIGRDARARGVHFMLGPGVNIYRSPRNGRNFEYFGEDPFLTSAMAVGYVTGMQEQDVSATIKHYIANNSEYLRHDSDSIVEERALRELYLPSFEAAIKKAHVGAVMDSYNLINGEHATQNSYLNIEVLRKEFGFTGTLMSDWDATYDGVAAANGGLDIEMPTGKFMNRATLEPAIQSGKVTEATIDEKIRHILTTAVSFGWLDQPNGQADPSISYLDARNNATALDSARESAVLLKNSGGLLPLNKAELKSVLVVGPDAYPGVAVGGGSAGVVPFHMVSPLEGLTDALGSAVTVFYDHGLPTLSDIASSTNYTTADGKPGVTLETFPNETLSGTPVVTSVNHINAAGITIDSIIGDNDLMTSFFTAKPKKVSQRWTGTYTAATKGEYIVVLEGSGEGSGNRVTLDGKQIIEDWNLVRADQPTVTVLLSAGPHKLIVEAKQEGLFGGHLRFGIAPASDVVSNRARELAAKLDAVIVTAGFNHASESEGGDRTFSLPFGQDQLIEAMASANKKTIVTITSGGNVDSTAWLDRVPAVLETWYAGQSGGTALAEILLGDVNPSGHLPATFERRAEDNPTFTNYYPEGDSKRVIYKEGIFVGYRGYEHNKVKPLFPFGFGLSYTTFEFANLAVTPSSAGANPEVTAAFDLKNTGSRKGADVAQLYVSEDHSRIPRPARELKGFERVELAPGETRHVTIHLDARAFAYYDTTAKKWTIDPGKFTINVGDNVESTPLHATVDLTREAATTTF